jgi:Ser/Thr protein kinase RdoA (MazF antagonist)
VPSTILEQFGLRESRVERTFATDLGAPKAEVPVRGFLGIDHRNRPRKQQLERTLERMNTTGRRLASEAALAEVGPYIPTPAGHLVVLEGCWHYLLTTFFAGRETEARGSQLLARVTGEFHRAGSSLVEAMPDDARLRLSVADELRDYVLPHLAMAADTGTTRPGEAVTSLVRLTDWLLERRADEIDDLPACYCHGDFQFRNVLVDDRTSDLLAVRIVDPGGAVVQSRLLDLYFLIVGDDYRELPGDNKAPIDRTAEYQQYARALGEYEVRLLPNAEQCKAAAIAAWPSRPSNEAPGKRRTSSGGTSVLHFAQ